VGRRKPNAGQVADAGVSFGALADVVKLKDLKLGREELTVDEKSLLIDQAIALLEGCYVHLPLKQKMHACYPVERLRVLGFRMRNRFEAVTERQFHYEMLSIFNSLRDLHTCYVLPQPYRRRVAFLPFMVEECRDDGKTQFVVSKVHGSVESDRFVPGVTVTHWNGVPIERVVELNARRRAGSNQAARRARGIDGLTFRWLGKNARPDEDWVTVVYRSEDGPHGRLTFPWRVALRPERGPTSDAAARPSEAFGLDEENEWIRQVKRELFAPADDAAHAGLTYPDAFRYREVPGAGGPYGYLRIFTFSVDLVTNFLMDAARLLDRAPPAGLILDVRGNGGGSIVAAERLLGLLAPGPIEPVVLQFLNTAMTQRIVEHSGFMAKDERKEVLRRSINVGRFTGSPFSRGLSLELPEARGGPSRAYSGPVVLVVDATSYSATDIFAAGFQDHAIGPVLGTAEQTGAGGANGWGYETVRKYLDDGQQPALQPLPHEASFSVAVRRAVRTGEMADTPLEDLGVKPNNDDPYPITRRDVLEDNADLVKAAIAMLQGKHLRPARFGDIAERKIGRPPKVR
jgi:C-terminal processing protease CtpA/Prc